MIVAIFVWLSILVGCRALVSLITINDLNGTVHQNVGVRTLSHTHHKLHDVTSALWCLHWGSSLSFLPPSTLHLVSFLLGYFHVPKIRNKDHDLMKDMTWLTAAPNNKR